MGQSIEYKVKNKNNKLNESVHISVGNRNITTESDDPAHKV
jgi:hypothetical protein